MNKVRLVLGGCLSLLGVTTAFAAGQATGETISINFGDAVSGDDYIGLAAVAASSWINAPVGSATGGQVAQVAATITDQNGNVYPSAKLMVASRGDTYFNKSVSKDTALGTLLYGYADDSNGGSGSNEVCVELANVPFTEYTVYVTFQTDNTNLSFSPYVINDRLYQGNADMDATEEITITTDMTLERWGAIDTAALVVGKNTLKVEGQTASTLKIYHPRYCGLENVPTARATNSRGTIACIQIVNSGEIIAEDGTTYDATAMEGTVNLSEVPSFATDMAAGSVTDATILLSSGATLVVDEAYALTLLTLSSEGDVTVESPVSALAGVGTLSAKKVSGTARFKVTLDGDETVTALPGNYGFDAVEISGTTPYSTTSDSFAGQTVTVGGGAQVTIDAPLSTAVATIESPWVVSGEGSELKIVDYTASRNRLPLEAYLKADDKATLAFSGVNLFPDAGRPYPLIDNATLRVDVTSGGHVKINTVVMQNNAAIVLAGTNTGWESEALVVTNDDDAQIVAMSGTDNTISYAEGATENKLVIDSGFVVQEDAKLTVDVALRDAFTKTGDGELALPASRLTVDATVAEGTLRVTDSSGEIASSVSGEGTLALDMTGATTLSGTIADTLNLVVTGDQTLALVASRPTIAAFPAGATLSITPTADEAVAGSLTLKAADGVTFTADKLVVEGYEAFTLGEDGLTITLSGEGPTWKASTGSWTSIPTAGGIATIDFEDTTDATCTWNHDSAITYAKLVVKGSGTIALTGDGAVTFDAIELPEDATQSVTMGGVKDTTLTGALSGAASFTWKSGWFIQQQASIIATTNYTGALTIAGGTWRWGGSGTGTIDASTTIGTLGSSVTVNSGARLFIHPWTAGGLQNKQSGDKVRFAAPIVLNGGSIWCEDGSYAFQSIEVAADSEMTQKWGGKAAVIERLFGAAKLSFNHDRHKDVVDAAGFLCVWYTYNQGASERVDFTGALEVTSVKDTFNIVLYPDTSEAFNKAKLVLNERAVLQLGNARSVGHLAGAGSVVSNTEGTARTLTIGGYTDAENATFSGSISSDVAIVLAEGAELRLGSAITPLSVTLNMDSTIESDSDDAGLTIPATGFLAGEGVIWAPVTFADGATLDATQVGLINADVTFEGALTVKLAAEPTSDTDVLSSSYLTALPTSYTLMVGTTTLDADTYALRIGDHGLVAGPKTDDPDPIAFDSDTTDVTVTANDVDAAIEAAKEVAFSDEDLSADYFTYTAEANGDGTYTVTLALNPAVVKPVIGVPEDEEEEGEEPLTIKHGEEGTALALRVQNPKPGLYYGLATGESIDALDFVASTFVKCASDGSLGALTYTFTGARGFVKVVVLPYMPSTNEIDE